MKISLRRFASFAILVLLTSLLSSAQDLDDVTISGKVVDSNNLPIVGATITATHIESNLERTVTSNEDGRYRFIELKPGVYKVRTTATGFGTKETVDLQTISGQHVQLDYSLAPAAVTASATVTVSEDEVPLVDTTRTVVGSTLTEREIEEIPTNSRNPLDLVLILGGTSEEQLSTRDLAEDRGARNLSAPGTTPEEAGIFGLSGGAAYSNNITIDGLDNNDDRSASFRFQPSIEAISEVQVITNQFSAEYGRASGGRVNLRTRGGSNKYRGRTFYFFRDARFTANTWRNNGRTPPIARPPFTNNNPGFTFGGPVVKNRLFFYTSYEYDDIKEDTILDAWVPLNFSNPSFPLPSPTDATPFTVTSGPTSVQVGKFLSPAETPAKNHLVTARGDWTINDAHNLTVSYQLGRSNDLRAFSGTNRIADSLIGRIRNTDAYNATHNFVISPRVVNQARFQYSTLKPSSAQVAGALTAAVLVTFTGPANDGGTQVYGSTTNSSDRTEDRWQFQDSVSFVAGSHTFRFGGDVQRVDTVYTDRFDTTGTYSFSNFVLFSQNSVSRYQQNFNNTSELKNDYVGVFAQGDWRVRQNFTFSYGLRYERESVIDDTNNFGPRVAFAWNPFPNGEKTVVRFGVGIFYNRVLLRTVDDYNSDAEALRLDTNSFNLPTGVVADANVWRPFLNTRFPGSLTIDTVMPINATRSFTLGQLARPSSVFRSLSPDLKIPESYQFNAGLEREVYKGLVFETNVTYNRTVRLWREWNPNAPVLPPGTPDRNSDGQITLTDYLLGITTGIHRFENGSPTDAVGLRPVTGTNCNSSGLECWINVNTRNSNSSTTCSSTTVTNTPVCRAFSVLNNLRPRFAQVGAVQLEEVASMGSSEYVGAVFELRTRYRKLENGFGGSLRAVYTLSRLMDDGIVNTSDPTLPGNFSREWSRSLADRTHRVAISGTFDTPKWLGKIRFSPIFLYGSGAPFNVSAGGIDRNLDDVSNDRPNFMGDPTRIVWRVLGSTYPEALASRFSVAPIGSPGNLPRNAGHGPQQFKFDLSITREFKFGERFRLRPVAEFTNPFNMRVFSFGSNFINFDSLNSTNPVTVQASKDAFLAPTRTNTHRRMRFGIRFDF